MFTAYAIKAVVDARNVGNSLQAPGGRQDHPCRTALHELLSNAALCHADKTKSWLASLLVGKHINIKDEDLNVVEMGGPRGDCAVTFRVHYRNCTTMRYM